MRGPLLDEFLSDPGRARFVGAAPVVSRRDDDDPAWAAELRAAGASTIELDRRGRSHGRVAVLPDDRSAPRGSRAAHHFGRARPIRIQGAVSARLADWRNEIHAARVRAEALSDPAGLPAWLRAALARSKRFAPGAPLEREDPERDVAAWSVRDAQGAAPWVKCARLSTHPADRSLRLRFGAGAEGEDDALDDETSAHAVRALAREACPEIGVVEDARALWSFVEAAAGAPLYPTGAIVYWNAPGGGARMHHDAFRSDDSAGQRGVLYAQLTGRTFWLALSSADLARRLVEFADLLRAGEFAWLRGESAPLDAALDALDALVEDPAALATEIALPDQGRLGPLVDRGPEFTLFLVDSGHGAVIAAGDAILLPNHGLTRTAMHSVFSASDQRTVALSFGLRADPRRDPSPDSVAGAGSRARGA